MAADETAPRAGAVLAINTLVGTPGGSSYGGVLGNAVWSRWSALDRPW